MRVIFCVGGFSAFVYDTSTDQRYQECDEYLKLSGNILCGISCWWPHSQKCTRNDFESKIVFIFKCHMILNNSISLNKTRHFSSRMPFVILFFIKLKSRFFLNFVLNSTNLLIQKSLSIILTQQFQSNVPIF